MKFRLFNWCCPVKPKSERSPSEQITSADNSSSSASIHVASHSNKVPEKRGPLVLDTGGDNLLSFVDVNRFIQENNFSETSHTIIRLEDSVTTIDPSCLNRIYFPFTLIAPGVTDLGYDRYIGGTFENNKFLKCIYLPNCEIVTSKAFKDCINLETVYLPKCKTVDYRSFYGCDSLNELSLPNCESLKSHQSLSGMPNLKYLNLASLNSEQPVGVLSPLKFFPLPYLTIPSVFHVEKRDEMGIYFTTKVYTKPLVQVETVFDSFNFNYFRYLCMNCYELNSVEVNLHLPNELWFLIFAFMCDQTISLELYLEKFSANNLLNVF